MFWTSGVIRLLNELLRAALRIEKLLRLRQPGLVWLKVVSEKENGMLKFVVVLPAPGASDVAKRELQVAIGSGSPATFELPGDALNSDEMGGEENETVAGQLIDIDDAGNRSEARTFSFVLVDTIAPPQPGELGLKVTAEE